MFFANRNFNEQRITSNAYTLLMPSISAGHIPQLSVDILLSNKQFTNIGNLDNRYTEPVAGHDESGTLATSLQVMH